MDPIAQVAEISPRLARELLNLPEHEQAAFRRFSREMADRIAAAELAKITAERPVGLRFFCSNKDADGYPFHVIPQQLAQSLGVTDGGQEMPGTPSGARGPMVHVLVDRYIPPGLGE